MAARSLEDLAGPHPLGVPRPDPIDPKKLVKAVAPLQHAIASAISEAHHGFWPADQDIEYTVFQRNGKVKIKFSFPFSKEPGYKDQ